ncbi:MAG: D-alanine--D-alanine ligase [Alistipes sp.]
MTTNTKLKIALLAGGNSSEREIALQSAAQIEVALDHNKYDITLIDLHYRDWVHTASDGHRYQVDKNDFSITIDGCHKAFDYALILIHGTPGENGMLQGYLDMMGISYSSCSMTSSVITFDKITTKRAVAGTGIPLAPEIFIRREDKVDPEAVVAQLGLPLFIKPNASGSSFGVTKVSSQAEILPAINAAFAESTEVLIEACITGREVGCGVLIADGKEYLFPITEIVSKTEFFDYQAKYTAGYSDEITPAVLSHEVEALLHKMCISAYKSCRCSGVVRIDFIVTADGTPYMIEVNSIPGMSAGSIVPKQVHAAGMTLAQLYDIIIADTYRKPQQPCSK